MRKQQRPLECNLQLNLKHKRIRPWAKYNKLGQIVMIIFYFYFYLAWFQPKYSIM